MNPSTPFSDDDLDALFARARAERPDTARAEYSFETRLLARLRAIHPPGPVTWGTLSWRMMPFFAALVLVLVCCHVGAVDAATDAEQAAYIDNSDTLDLSATLN